MTVKIIKTQKDAKEIRFGDQYIIDIYPDDLDEFLNNEEKLFAKAEKIISIIEKNKNKRQ